jgi:ABC-type lipoprotein release transport system permease subunit
MSVIDNGRRVPLTVTGVFEGEAGEVDGLLAFIPNRKGKRARYARSGLLDGVEVRLVFAGEEGAFVSFRYEPVGGPA